MIDVKVVNKITGILYAEGKITEPYGDGNWTADVYVIGEEDNEPNFIRRRTLSEVKTEIQMRYQNYECIFQYELG